MAASSSKSDLPSKSQSTGFKAWFVSTVIMDLMACSILRVLCLVRSRGRHHVPKEGPFILACNHVTWIDSLFLIPPCRRRLRFMITYTMHRKPKIHPFTSSYRSIPMDKKKPRAGIMAAIRALKGGDAICIYPEGGFTQNGEIRDIQRGVEVMAKAAKCPTVPVIISGLFGSALALRRGWKPKHLWTKPWPRVRVSFGEPIPHERMSPTALEAALKELQNPDKA